MENPLFGIKSYCTTAQSETRLTDLSLLSIEKELLLYLKENSASFYDDVIEQFLKKDRRIDLIFK